MKKNILISFLATVVLFQWFPDAEISMVGDLIAKVSMFGLILWLVCDTEYTWKSHRSYLKRRSFRQMLNITNLKGRRSIG